MFVCVRRSPFVINKTRIKILDSLLYSSIKYLLSELEHESGLTNLKIQMTCDSKALTAVALSASFFPFFLHASAFFSPADDVMLQHGRKSMSVLRLQYGDLQRSVFVYENMRKPSNPSSRFQP